MTMRARTNTFYVRCRRRLPRPLRFLMPTWRQFYLEYESLALNLDAALRPTVDDHEFVELTLDDVKALPPAMIDPDQGAVYPFAQRLADGCLGLGLRHDGQILAYTWANLQRCTFPPFRGPLREDEAYLFNAFTHDRCRGHNVAPALRLELYRRLAAKGRQHLFSGTAKDNPASLRFKEKLHVQHLGLFLRLNFGNDRHASILLRRYGASPRIPVLRRLPRLHLTHQEPYLPLAPEA